MTDIVAKKHNDILKLISLLKLNPCLWNANETGNLGGNHHERKHAYERIAAEFCCSSEDIRNKFRNLRAQFRREVQRQERLNTKRPKWIYYNALSFLRPTISSNNGNKRTRATANKQQAIESDIDVEWESSPMDENATMINFNEESEFKTCELPTPALEQESVGGNTQVTLANSTTAAKCKSDGNGERVFVVSNHHTLPEERDEFTIFGEHVANELRLLEKHKTLQKALKCSILQSILDANRVDIDNEQDYNNVFAEEAYLEGLY